VAAAVGSGMTASAAEEGGADFLIVLAAGFFRTHGVGSAAAFMPYANANQLTWRIASEHVVPRVRRTPVFVGVCAQDPGLDLDTHLRRVADLGVVGVANYPTIGLFDGSNRALLEADGLSFDAEVAMLVRARERGLLTFGFAATPEDAEALSRAGVEILGLTLGAADLRLLEGSEHQAALDRALVRLRALVQGARRGRADAYCVVTGGPVVLPEDTAFMFERAEVLGYLGGSPIERFPAAPAVAQAVRELKNAAATATRGREAPRLGAMLGASRAMQDLFATVRSVAATDATVLLIGESGTGKEMVAREIHRLSHLHDRTLVTWNCGAISESLAMSELFGHEKGAFTGATRTHAGKFESAHGGTLFMDEVTDLPASVQAALLRVLQQREIVRVGGERTIFVNVRVIAASNQEFSTVVPAGRFRLDLYYRLSTVILRVPPLRERTEDIPLLVRAIAEELSQKYGRPAPRLGDALMAALLRHSWPGNIRELRNAVERVFLLPRAGAPSRAWLEEMLAADRALGERLAPANAPYLSLDARRSRLAEVLARHDGNRTAAARELGVSRKTIHKWLKQR
jgi:two-component system response regulator HydG